jgi:hypothetical protein
MDFRRILAYKGDCALYPMEWTIMKQLIGVVAVLAAGAGLMYWFSVDGPASKSSGQERVNLNANPIDEDEQSGQFGADRAGKDARPVAFDGKRGMKYLQDICDIGPRMSGSRAMKKQQDLIKKHFEDLGAKVTLQTWDAEQNSIKGKIGMTNIIVSFKPEMKRRVILCSHYDTRPFADQEDDPRLAKKPDAFISANDGGSGVAFLMELGHHMKDLKTQVGVDFVFFDGEELIFVKDGPRKDRYFIGSEHFARTWLRTPGKCEYSAAVLLDMIAGREIRFPVEVNSARGANNKKLCEEIWGIAREQNVKAFVPMWGHEVQDDHLSLQNVHIPAIDIIDFDYPHWHKLSDTPAQCSGKSMEDVAKVLSVWLQRTK